MTMIRPFLMFQGNARQALELYAAAIPDLQIASVTYQDGGAGPVQVAELAIGEQRILVIDSPVTHEFSFTPSLSLHVTFADAAAVDQAFHVLADGGTVMMPLDSYPFSARYVWFNDRFGVSWQLSADQPQQ